jgi:hypothetical protein
MTKLTLAERWLARQARRAGKDENEVIASFRLRKEESFAWQAEQAKGRGAAPGEAGAAAEPGRFH